MKDIDSQNMAVNAEQAPTEDKARLGACAGRGVDNHVMRNALGFALADKFLQALAVAQGAPQAGTTGRDLKYSQIRISKVLQQCCAL